VCSPVIDAWRLRLLPCLVPRHVLLLVLLPPAPAKPPGAIDCIHLKGTGSGGAVRSQLLPLLLLRGRRGRAGGQRRQRRRVGSSRCWR
jgi:hypothetical protein